jgi:dUTP pyrophosphatase
LTDMEHTVLKIKKLRPSAVIPQRATPGATGLDLFACMDDDGVVALGTQPRLVGTGIAIEVPRGYDVQIRPRSGLSAKGVGVAFGTLDSDYRGEVMVTMYLFSPDASFKVRHGDRIAQMVISRVADLPVVEVDELTLTERGGGGHGSTGR